MKKMILSSIAILIIAIGMTAFIIYSNDHIECEITTEVTYGTTGEKITTKTHICKETYNM